MTYPPPSGMPADEWSPQPPLQPPQPGSGRLVVDVSGPASWQRSLYRYLPKLSIKGQPLVTIGDGQTPIDLPAGRYELIVGIGTNYTRAHHYGKAHLTADVLPGHTTTVYYCAPALAPMSGAIGFVPQAMPGRVARAALLLSVGALTLAAVLVALL